MRNIEVQEIVIPNTVTEIGESTFAGHGELMKIIISRDSVLQKIKCNAFARTGIE